MIYTNSYESPLGNILLAGDEQGLTGLWFTEGGRYLSLYSLFGINMLPYSSKDLLVCHSSGVIFGCIISLVQKHLII